MEIIDLKNILKRYGFREFKDESKFRTYVLTNDNRIEVLKKIETIFEDLNGKHEYPGSSSIGMITVGKYAVGVKPKSRQGRKSAGIENEMILVNMINDVLTKQGKIHVTFQESRAKQYQVKNVVKIEEAGRDTLGRKKSDVNLIDEKGKSFPISIKKDGAEMWESTDTYWKDKLLRIVNNAVKKNLTSLQDHPTVTGVKKIQPNIATKLTTQEKRELVFGSDILNNGAVIERTFDGKYQIDSDNEQMIIDVSKIITNENQLTGNYDVYMLIRNDSSRKGTAIPGIRTLAVKKTRINRNVVIVPRI